ncbi:hypothetical protein GY21_14100 [Cryobacterium roopkundense]|uniref:Uncharacterized protein n=1 Tax=Cryobacterium roopkundense TaxID=1001240 RepID=A0A099J2Y8_9MICO|nr:hypothetical protein [Cryobacterium roopkundense]KGJ72636.1 hypothetical protein GY21_14100 [Cryobacterium roopkundense]MBB5641921.1 hypothetical protein [Cryobacterium roopkundense]
MSESNRKPIIIACAVAGLVLVLFLMGVGFGRGDRPAGGSTVSGLAGIGPVAALETTDLVLSNGDCAISGQLIQVQQTCTFTIAEFGGTFDLGPVTKRARLTVLSAPGEVTVSMLIEGTDAAQKLEQGDSTDLTVGRSGGSLTFDCPGFDACILQVSPI